LRLSAAIEADIYTLIAIIYHIIPIVLQITNLKINSKAAAMLEGVRQFFLAKLKTLQGKQ
jgi:hypothetical protein